jgi:hypothetical protein
MMWCTSLVCECSTQKHFLAAPIGSCQEASELKTRPLKFEIKLPVKTDFLALAQDSLYRAGPHPFAFIFFLQLLFF